ncbi:hypothetical protein OC835_004135 [Tilletia horrida]|nr:hypothetical protein OC835_004135 [Tilletia horrida]
MLGFLKASGRKLALVLLALQLVTASPFALDGDELDSSSLVLGRAVGGKYVGSSCTSNSECHSANCVKTNGTATSTCQRQPAGGPCFADSNCLSRNCDQAKGACRSYPPGATMCSYAYECTSIYTYTCSNGVCLLQDDKACKFDAECASSFCQSGVCRQRPQPPFATCHVDSECLSGKCDVGSQECHDPDGSLTLCDNGYTDTSCRGYPLGHSCANDGECDVGFCRSGVCSASKDGDACKAMYQCVGASTCGDGGKCYTPAKASLYPNEPCHVNASCVSGRCSRVWTFYDDNGFNPIEYDDRDPSRCEHLNAGQSGCRTFKDCSHELCQGGVCKYGQPGDRCSVTYQCSDFCSLEGRCYKPSKAQDQGAGQPCRIDGDCLSNACEGQDVTRPLLSDPSQTISAVDFLCAPSAEGRGCHTSSDCVQGGVCSSQGICTFVQNNGTCTRDDQCSSTFCLKTGKKQATSGICAKATGGLLCAGSDDGNFCFSGSCVQECPLGYNSCDDPYYCTSVDALATCRVDSDCMYGSVCSPDKKCRATNDNLCNVNEECVSGYCKDGQVCKAAKTSSTTTKPTTKATSSSSSSSSKTTSTTKGVSSTTAIHTSKSTTSTKATSSVSSRTTSGSSGSSGKSSATSTQPA